MKKHPLKTEMIKENHVRYTLKLESEDPLLQNQALFGFLQELVDNPYTLRCGNGFPDNINIRWNGETWVLTATLEEQLDRTLDFMDEQDDN